MGGIYRDLTVILHNIGPVIKGFRELYYEGAEVLFSLFRGFIKEITLPLLHNKNYLLLLYTLKNESK